jgi:hypothetical protein
MVYTLYLSDHAIESTIKIYSHKISKDQYNLVWIDGGKYVLNYLHDEIINKKQLSDELDFVKSITIKDLKLDKIR